MQDNNTPVRLESLLEDLMDQFHLAGQQIRFSPNSLHIKNVLEHISDEVDKVINHPLVEEKDLSGQVEEMVQLLLSRFIEDYLRNHKDILFKVSRSFLLSKHIHYTIVLTHCKPDRVNGLNTFIQAYRNTALGSQFTINFNYFPRSWEAKARDSEVVNI